MESTNNTTQQAPVVVPRGMGPVFDLGDHRGWAKISSQHTDGAFLLVEVEADLDGGVPPHVHAREDEMFHILAGRFEITIGERTIEARTGDMVFAPRNIPHSWYCVGDAPGRFVLLVTPGTNFESFATEMAERGIVPAEAMRDPESAASFLALSERHGIEMLPPGK